MLNSTIPNAGRRRVLRPAARARALLALRALAFAALAGASPAAAEPVRLAVFPIELEDFSAGGGVVATDERDATYLAQATQEAKRGLAASGRYALVDTSGVEDEPVKSHTLHDCGGCVGPIAKMLGADQAVVGVITRVSRTEYTLLMQFFDANSGEPVARYFTGLRLGADYSWPRSVKWLLKRRILAKDPG
jgi:Protein of unknown function (DUF2380)